MWFFVPAIILVVLFALWIRRTNLYRHYRRGHRADPGQAGYAAGWEGSSRAGGDIGGGGGDGGGLG
jgi:hypothetical protein